MDWYNGTHRHSAIRYVTPDQRHHGADRAVLASPHELYERVRQANPQRWSGNTRNWFRGVRCAEQATRRTGATIRRADTGYAALK